MADILSTARKDFRGFFATPAAYLFIGGFLAVNLFIFFWVETFFARNIADVRPLFKWMPVLLIFLVAALTMRAWSEERRSGTLETLLTAPVRPASLVLGKFLAALGLVALALALTVPLPVTVSLLGPLDWGPVAGGYVATLFLAAAYISIGLYMSALTDNPIVALILTALVGGIFYLAGSDVLTGLFGNDVAGILALIGSGTRFESITRGVLDLRDLYYYLSIMGVFLTLNLFGLEKLRWAGNPASRRHRLWGTVAGLAVLNFLLANVWLAPITAARADMTREHVYSLSDATTQQLKQLREPLIIRGYFSAHTHPLLAPLVPRLRDLLTEYAIAAGGRAQVEFVDPTSDPAQEEAAAKYSIRPVPFQTASRYSAGVVNSYFNIVVAYGDQYEALSYADLIEVKSGGPAKLDVALKNPEYEITRAIRKVVHAYTSGGSPFATFTQPVTFKGYLSPDAKLPEELQKLHGDLKTVLDDLQKQAGDKLKVSFEDPDADGGKLAEQLNKDYGLGPQVASLLDPQPFWFYMMLEGSSGSVQVPLPDTLDQASLKRSIEAALHRLAPGFLKTVALVKPQAPANPYMQQSGPDYSQLEAVLSENNRVIDTDLKNGKVPEDADLLMVLAPKDLDDKQRFAIDQFLMRGGSVVLGTSPFAIDLSQTLSASRQTSGLDDWLAHYGITIDNTMVLDPQNAALPVPVERNVGGLTMREIRMMPYPHFPDLRGGELNGDSPVTAGLEQLTLDWASPVAVDAKANQGREITTLLRSSPQSWTSDSLDVLPDYRQYPDSGFPAKDKRGASVLGVALEGSFDSFFAGKDSPLLTRPDAAAKDADKTDADKANAGNDTPASAKDKTEIAGVIDKSPDTARLIVLGSNAFATDTSLDLASQGLRTRYAKPLEFMQNVVDWSLEDQSLLALRGRSQFARTLFPLPENQQRLLEYANYGIALFGLILVWGWRRLTARSDHRRYQRILQEA